MHTYSQRFFFLRHPAKIRALAINLGDLRGFGTKTLGTFVLGGHAWDLSGHFYLFRKKFAFPTFTLTSSILFGNVVESRGSGQHLTLLPIRRKPLKGDLDAETDAGTTQCSHLK